MDSYDSERLSLEAWLRKLAEQEIQSSAHLQATDPGEWARRFQSFLDSQDPNTPVLSDEAMSREIIYP